MKDFILDPDKNMNWNFANRTDGSVCSFKGVSCWNPWENRVLSLSLNSMSLSGTIPSSLQYCSSTANLDLSGNLFSGPIPPDRCRWLPYLTTLDLSGNQLSGSIPPDLSNCSYLNTLLLSGNQLSGPIPPSLDRLQRLRHLDLSSDQLSGAIPARLATSFAASTFSGNPALCGYPLSSGCSRHSLSRASLIIIVVGVVGAVTLCSYVAAYWIWKSRNTKSLPTANTKDQHMTKVSYAELAKATDGFAPTNLIGEGSFGSVYKGIMVLDGTRKFVAVKVINLREKRALKSFAAECEALKNIRHRNLLKILTLCSSVDFRGNDFKALVFDYMTNGSLEEWLHHHGVNERGDESKSFLDFFQRLRA